MGTIRGMGTDDQAESRSAGEQDQRREHVRVDLSRRCAVQFAGQPTASGELTGLSGTGCSVRMVGAVKPSQHGHLRVSFDDWTVSAGFVVRYVRPDGDRNIAGLLFEGLERSDVDRLVREVFVELQRQITAHRTQ